MQERAQRPVCQSCGKRPAKYIVDVRGAVTILGQYLCGVCMKSVMRKCPASQAVNLPQYEEQWNANRGK